MKSCGLGINSELRAKKVQENFVYKAGSPSYSTTRILPGHAQGQGSSAKTNVDRSVGGRSSVSIASWTREVCLQR